MQINKIGEFKKENNNFYSQEYSVSSNVELNNYQITGISNFPEGSYISSLSNEPKTEFAGGENFKILIPKEKILENFEGKIQINGKLKSYPIFYGKSYDSNLQDYALTGDFYESGNGNAKDNYYKNETKIIIVKKDQETGNALEGVEFQLLDENKNVVYTDLKTDKEGKIIIDNLIPGTYYLKETKTIDGYELYENLINVDISLNQEVTVTVNNNKEDEPEIETKEEKSKEILSKDVAQEKVKKLPVTGM